MPRLLGSLRGLPEKSKAETPRHLGFVDAVMFVGDQYTSYLSLSMCLATMSLIEGSMRLGLGLVCLAGLASIIASMSSWLRGAVLLYGLGASLQEVLGGIVVFVGVVLLYSRFLAAIPRMVLARSTRTSPWPCACPGMVRGLIGSVAGGFGDRCSGPGRSSAPTAWLRGLPGSQSSSNVSPRPWWATSLAAR